MAMVPLSADFEPHLPSQWKLRLEKAIERLRHDGLGAQPWDQYLIDEKK